MEKTLIATKITAPVEKNKKTLMQEYERVVIESLLTTFALDGLITDRNGGDVDTIVTVRELEGEDQFKNKANRAAYEGRGEYDSSRYHSHAGYIKKNREVSKAKKEGKLKDAYGDRTFRPNEKVDLDHVIAAKEIHDDPAVYLAEADPADLANSDENLKPTSAGKNRAKGQKTDEEYIADWEAKRPARQARVAELKAKSKRTAKEEKELRNLEATLDFNKEKLRKARARSKRIIDAELARKYYTSKKFFADTGKAAAKNGAKMGLRQVLGFVLTEMWFAAKERLATLSEGCGFKRRLKAIKDGAVAGLARAREKYREIIKACKEGAVSGIISSITTTVINMFTKMLKGAVRLLRNCMVSIVKAFKLLFFDKDKGTFQERLQAALVILSTGVGIAVGALVESLIADKLAAIPLVGDLLSDFLVAFASGIVTCTLIYTIDKYSVAQKICAFINKFDPFTAMVEKMREEADYFEAYARKLLSIDVAAFRKEGQDLENLIDRLMSSESIEAQNRALSAFIDKKGFKKPFKGDFNKHMANPMGRLVFE